nr:hypothetical protein [Tanacetum cinerariifolium]
TDEGTGSRPGVPDVPSDDSEEELSWNSSDDEDVDEQTKGREESEGDKTDEREFICVIIRGKHVKPDQRCRG